MRFARNAAVLEEAPELGLGSPAIAVRCASVNGSFPMAFGRAPLEWSLRRPSWGTLPELHELGTVTDIAQKIRDDLEPWKSSLVTTLLTNGSPELLRAIT